MSSIVKSILSSLKKLLKPDEDIECLHYNLETPEERAEYELCDEMCDKCADDRVRRCHGPEPWPEAVHGL